MGYSIIDNKGKGNTDKKKTNVSFMAIEPEWTLDEIIFSHQRATFVGEYFFVSHERTSYENVIKL